MQVGGFSPDMQPAPKPAMSGLKPPTYEMRFFTDFKLQRAGSISYGRWAWYAPLINSPQRANF
ncbi:MAG: hypothetical protein CFE38_11755 [Comamonadaceae bacterium PBBC1]|nr:MAG: hypothetical protein CFE38_11755 [Comamonadaceae bacterium PBBC1]